MLLTDKKLLLIVMSGFLFGCTATPPATKVDSPRVNKNHEIIESEPVKLRKLTPKETAQLNKEKNATQQTYQAISSPLEANKLMKEAYLLKLKGLEYMIETLEK